MMLSKKEALKEKTVFPYRRTSHPCARKRNSESVREKPSGFFPKRKYPNKVRILLDRLLFVWYFKIEPFKSALERLVKEKKKDVL